MTVKELIDGLSKLNPDHEIAVAWDMGFEDSDEITPEELLLGVPLGLGGGTEDHDGVLIFVLPGPEMERMYDIARNLDLALN
jgi:hypothetical protein